MSPSTLVNNYLNLLKNKHVAEVKHLFEHAKYCNINTLTPRRAAHNVYFFLGVSNQVLHGIYVEASICPLVSELDEMKTTVVPFTNNSLPAIPTINADIMDPNQINQIEFNNRTLLWTNTKDDFISNHVNAGTMVQYFEIACSNFKSYTNNYSVFGLRAFDIEDIKAPIIDLITVNDKFMDTTRPVPPFKINL